MHEQFTSLVSYITQCRQQGMPDHLIRSTLLQHDWDVQLVDSAFYALHAAAAQQPAAPQSPALTQPTLEEQAVAPQKYKIIPAVRDTLRAIRTNLRAFLIVTAVSYIGVAGLIGVQLLVTLLLYSNVDVTVSGLLFTFVSVTILSITCQALCNALVLTTASVAIYEGAQGRRSAASSTLAHSFTRLGRLMLATMLFGLVAVLPLILLVFISLLQLMTGFAMDGISNPIIGILTVVGGIAWAIIAVARYGLAPYVALFEPDIPISKTLTRSRYLQTKGGQWFIVKGLGVLLLLSLPLQPLARLERLETPVAITLMIVSVIIGIILNGVMVMLYRNRRIVRG